MIYIAHSQFIVVTLYKKRASSMTIAINEFYNFTLSDQFIHALCCFYCEHNMSEQYLLNSEIL